MLTQNVLSVRLVVIMNNPYLGSQGRLLGALASEHSRSLSYAGCCEEGPERWAKRARAALEENLNFSPKPVPLDAQVLTEIQADGYTRQTVEFASSRHHRIRGELLVPDRTDRPLPAVLALHDHGGFYSHGREKLVEGLDDSPALLDFVDMIYSGRYWASELARRGYVVLVTDVLGWGERRMPVNDLPEAARNTLKQFDEKNAEWTNAFNSAVNDVMPALNQHANWAGISWMGLVVWDDRRALDYLLSRPEVDSDRVACAGLSGGGWRSTYLFGIEPRFAAGAIAGWMACLGDQLLHESRCHIGMYTAPSVYAHLDHPDIAAIGAPRPLMILQCEQDNLFSIDSMKASCDNIRRVYDDHGKGDCFNARFYDAPHCLDRKMQEEMFTWFDRWLMR